MIVKSEQSLRLYAFGALAWLGLVALVLTGLVTKVREAPFVAIPVFGVFVWFAWKFARRWSSGLGAYVNFGSVRLALERAPSVGGELKGAVEFESGAAALAKLEAELVCTRAIPKQPHDAVVVRMREVVHSETSVLAVQVEPGQRRAPFAFAIPASACPSGEADRSEEEERPPTYTWQLRLEAPNAGGDLARSFSLQVLPAGARADEPRAEEAQQSSAGAALALVAANLLPLALVLLGLGSAGGLVVLYWAENVVIGFYTVLRMLTAGRGSVLVKTSETILFCFHYGMFCLVHGIFVTTLFLSREQQAAVYAPQQWPGPFFLVEGLWLGAKAMGLFSPGALLLPLAALAASHGVSFYKNYLRNGRYLTARPDDSFGQPYSRILLLHLFIVGGAFFIASQGSTAPMLAALVVGKTLLDLALHRRGNRAG